jgi:hypothetical protein
MLVQGDRLPRLLADLEVARKAMHGEIANCPIELEGTTWRQLLLSVLRELHAVMTEFGFRGPRDQLQRALEDASNPRYDAAYLEPTTGTLERNLLDELRAVQFFYISPAKERFYSAAVLAFGEQTVAQFPGVERDARDAYQCFALEQWTATVFHSMRILEQGLWWLAAEVGIPDPDKQSQANLIEQIDKQIKIMRSAPSSATKTRQLPAFSQAALEFGYFKDAWRNHVAHSHESYDEQDARKVITHVTDFIGRLAKERAESAP